MLFYIFNINSRRNCKYSTQWSFVHFAFIFLIQTRQLIPLEIGQYLNKNDCNKLTLLNYCKKASETKKISLDFLINKVLRKHITHDNYVFHLSYANLNFLLNWSMKQIRAYHHQYINTFHNKSPCLKACMIFITFTPLLYIYTL